MKVKIRPAKEEDKPFITASWLNSYLSSGNWQWKPSKGIYFENHEKRIKELMKIGLTLVATTEDDDQIVGYVVATDETVHFCYVKSIFRRLGISKQLMRWVPERKYFSQYTAKSKLIKGDLKYNPYEF